MICKICEREVPRLKEDLCSHCEFWLDVTKETDIHPIFNGNCYCLAVNIIDNRNPKWNGFGGRWFKITFNDGRVFYTNNLFHNGVVPDLWKSKLPDNCVLTEHFDMDEIDQYKNIQVIRRKDVLVSGMQIQIVTATQTNLFT